MLVGGPSRTHRDQQMTYHRNQKNGSSIDEDLMETYLSQDRTHMSSKMVQEVASSVVIESLSAEWWTANLSQTVINDLLENLLPLVVLACEKVIKEADERHLIATNTPDRSFNPINLLASFLMRNNPKYIHYSSLSPYHYSMKTLLHTKKVQVLKLYGEEETLLRTMIKQRQAERNEMQDTITKEERRRKDALKSLFLDWNVPERGWIQTKLINNMLEQYTEMCRDNDLQMNVTSFPSHRMHLRMFVENFLNSLNNQSSENFDLIVSKYRLCAQAYANIVQENKLNILLQRLFMQLDDRKSGYLLRGNVMKLLEEFYNLLNEHDKQFVNRPDQWPVIKQNELLNEIKSSKAVSLSETAEKGKSPDLPVTNEQPLAPSSPPVVVSTSDKIDEENEQSNNDPQSSSTFELKHPSVYEAEYRFTNERIPIYNLEHFSANDYDKSIQFDEQLIDKIQFSALVMSFISTQRNDMAISSLVDYFRSNYKETSEENNDKSLLVQQRLDDKQQRAQCDALFEKLNTTCTGVIKLEPLAIMLKQYKDGAVAEQIEQILQSYQDQTQLTSTQFFDLIIHTSQTLNESSGGVEKLEDLLKHIENQQPQLNSQDRARIRARLEWLRRIRSFSFRSLGHLYKEVMEIIQKDAEIFGGQPTKHLSIYIALLENDKNQLRYVAATNDQTDLLLGKTLKRGEGISFQILDSGKWAYINQTKRHSRIKFFNPDAKEQSGSFVLLPLKRVQRTRSNGILGIDTIQDKREKAFVQHEVQFYEGVASALADVFTFADFDKNMMKILHRFAYWVSQRCPKVSIIDYYTYEPVSMTNPAERVLKHAFTYSKGNLTTFSTPKPISSHEQVFKYYLERAAATCQSTVTTYLGETHMLQVLHGRDNFCFALIDTNTGEIEELPSQQKQDLMSMYYCIHMAVEELEEELINDTAKPILTYENRSDEMRVNFLFDRIWYTDTCNRIKCLPTDIIHEFMDNKSTWNDKTEQILSIISLIVQQKEIDLAEFAETLLPAMIEFDPTAANQPTQNDLWTRAEQLIKIAAIDESMWQQSSSNVIKIFFDWLYLACELNKLS